ncbi:MAG: cellulase family glycosylhydrolase, partial [Gammaproteobacteria bacterium]|nr:cellulase family glycosylhydrolase [Gammaproteobacteria bacterium]
MPDAGGAADVRQQTSAEMEKNVPEGHTIAPQLRDGEGPNEFARWSKDLFAWNASPVDLSFLNAGHRPAGRNGRLRAEGERLVFEDGTEARFWGVNLQASALFETQPENVSIHAKRMARLGINLVRFHHHDSPWVNPNIFGDYSQILSTRTFDAKSMRMLDRWIYTLKQEGIYVWLDLHVQRNFKAGDNIKHFTELAAKTKGKGKGRWVDLKGYSYLNESITERMHEFTESYLSHVNEFTGTAYKDEPAIIGLLITNENDVTHHYGNRFLPDKNVPEHNKLFDVDRRAFSMRSGIPFKDTFKTWEPGPSKLYLNDLEHRWNVRMLAQLRMLGADVPVATTNLWGRNPAFSLPALTDSTIMDTHAYASGGELAYDPRQRAHFLTQTALAAIVDKPVSISEWNVARFPERERVAIPILVAAISSLQEWDAAMLYGYSQRPLNESNRARNWSSYNDPAIMGIMPLGALMFRRGDVSLAKRTYCLKLNQDTLFNRETSGETSATLRTLIEQHRFLVALPQIPQLPWLKAKPCPKETEIVTDVNH